MIQETRQRLNGNGNGHQPRKRRARAPCGRCDANRQIELGDGTVMRCPDCHPLAAGVAS